MLNNGLQEMFFKTIRQKLPTGLSLVNAVASHLHISHDSAYRRIRGAKSLTIDELKELSSAFNISVDSFLRNGSTNEHVMFSGQFIPRDDGSIENYLQGLAGQLTYFNSFQHQRFLYMNKDFPIFHLFMFPELAAFKCYFWSRYNLNYKQFNRGRFVLADHIEVYKAISKQISQLYVWLPSTEVWNLDSICLTIRQINYFEDAKIFASEDDARTVRAALSQLIDHIEDQVEEGVKFIYGDITKGNKKGAKYTMFINEFSIGDNTVYMELDDLRIVSVNHNVLNYIMTTDPVFVEYTRKTIEHLLKKSTLISEVGEKERHLFFDTLRQRIDKKISMFL